jgi:putative transposase
MPRSPRILVAGGFYHVTARGNRRARIYEDDRDHERYLEGLSIVVPQLDWRLHTYCLMPNHVHLVVETPAENLSEGIQLLNGGYAQWFNRRHDLDGHVFQGRFNAKLITGEAYLDEVSRYVVNNPCRAGLCASPAQWRWSSYRAFVGKAASPPFLTVDWLLARYGDRRELARARYAEFVRNAPAYLPD